MIWRLIPFLIQRTEVGRRFAKSSTKLIFYSHRFAHAQSEQVDSARLGSRAMWEVVKLAIDPIIYAVFAVTIFGVIPITYQEFVRSRGWPTLPLPFVTTESYIGLMRTVAQAAATMLALFFTAVSVVVSTSYSKVSTESRILIAKDDLNRRYLRLLAHIAATAMVAIGLHAIGVPDSSVLVGYVIFLSVVSLLAFLPLGIRNFAHFDVSNLTGYQVRAFNQAVSIVTRSGKRWLDPSFQNYANEMAENQLRLLSDTMVFVIAENRPRHNSVLSIAKIVNILAWSYIPKKLEIPSESFWFTRKPEFKRWEVADSSMTGLALHTGVAPSPDLVPDHCFVEAQCTEMTVQCIKHLMTHDACNDVVNLLLEVIKTTKIYAQQFEMQGSMQLVGAVRTVVVEYLKKTDTAGEPLKLLQMVDVLCVASIEIIINSGASLTEKPIRELISNTNSLLRLDRREVYAKPHPRKVLREAEDLFKRLEFERATECTIRTQPWYVQQIIAFAYAEVIRNVIQSIVEVVKGEFVSPAADLITAKRSLCAGVWLQRAIEAYHRAKDWIENLETRYTELKGFHVTELQWQPSGADNALAEIEAARVKIVHLLANIVPDLSTVPSGGTLPDFLGQVRAWLAEELIAMMELKQEEGFEELFLSYFESSLTINWQFIQFSRQPGKQDYIRVAMDVMLDVMEISGLAFLFSELDGTKFNKIVATAWDQYFERATDKLTLVRGLYAVIESKLTLPVFSSSAMQRQVWGQSMAMAMVDRGIDVDRHFGPSWMHKRMKPHPSAVIESVLVSLGHLMNDPHEYFGALYIAAREDAKGIKLPMRIENCIKSIERAQKRHTEFKDEEKIE